MHLQCNLFLFLLSALQFSFGQSVSQARKRWQATDEKVSGLVLRMGQIQADFFASEKPGLRASDLRDFSELCEKQIPTSDQDPEKAYARLAHELSAHTRNLQGFCNGWQPDSALSWRTKALASQKNLISAAAVLEHSVSVYCLMNKLNKPEDKSRIPGHLREEYKRMEYLISIQQILFPVIQAEQNCLIGFQPDSTACSEKRRLVFSNMVARQTTLLKNLPPLKGDRFVKPAALNSLYQFAMEAKNDLHHLEKFLEAEKEFILIHQKCKSAGQLSTEETESYRKAVKKYNADIRAANELVKELQKKRDTHLQAFFAAQQALLEENLSAFQE